MSDLDMKQINTDIGELGAALKETREQLAEHRDALAELKEDKIAKRLAGTFLSKQEAELAQKAEDEKREALFAKLDTLETALTRMNGGAGDGKAALAKQAAMMRSFIRAGGHWTNELRNYALNDKEYREALYRSEFGSKENRTLQESVLFDGGYLVPEHIEAEIIRPAINLSPVRELARVVQTTSFQYVYHDLTAQATAYWTDETTDGTNSSPTYGEGRIVVHNLKVKIPAFEAWLEDCPNPESEMSETAGLAFEKEEGQSFCTGSGVNEPFGFETRHNAAAAGANYILTGNNAGADAVAADDFYDLLYGTSESTGLQEKYRRNAIFGFNSNTLRKVLKLQDGGGNYLWNSFAGLQRGEPATIAGKPFRILEDMDDDGTNANNPVVCADWKAYYRIVDRAGIRILRDPYSSNPTVLYRWTKRLGADVTQLEAGRLLVV